MFKLLLLLTLLSVEFLFADMPLIQGPDTFSTQQREIKTVGDYKEFERTIIQMVKMGDKSKLYLLGALYSQDIKLANGKIIPANYAEAKKHFLSSAKSGTELAYFNLGMIAISEKKYSEALTYYQQGAASKQDNIAAPCAAGYASTVLDHFPSDKNKLVIANSLLVKYASRRNLPTASFLMANVLLNLGNEKEANRYLSIACNNPLADQKIKDFCFGDEVEVNTKDGKKLNEKKTCPTCPISK